MPPPSTAVQTPQIFPRIFGAFLRDSGTSIFQTPKREKKSAQKWAQKSAHQKSTQKSAQKSAHQKSAQKSWVQKWAQKSAHQKSAQNTGLNIPFVWKMEAKKNKKNLHQTCAKPQPQSFSRGCREFRRSLSFV